MPIGDKILDLARMELVQSEQEGRNLTDYRERIEEACQDAERLKCLIDEMQSLPMRADFPYVEPVEWSDIVAERSVAPANSAHAMTDAEWNDKLYGAWLGRCAGCALGMPLEAAPFEFGTAANSGWENIRLWFERADEWLISNYTPGESKARTEFGLALTEPGRPAQRENLQYMPSDDDIRYTVLATLLLEQKGIDFESYDVGLNWYRHLSYNQVFTAEAVAYLNFAPYQFYSERDLAIRWQRSRKSANTHLNPYREWIGAQIRADGYAYGAAGNPALASELAWRDASFSHVKNGVYGAMYMAAIIAAAFVERDIRKIVQIGLSHIPQNSRLANDIREAVGIALSSANQLELVERTWEAFKHYHAVHTNNNAALVTAALVYANGDFQTAITTAVLGGWDTDCNGASVGSVMGAMLGASNLPRKWTEPLQDTLYADIQGFHPIRISACAERSFKVFKKIRNQVTI